MITQTPRWFTREIWPGDDGPDVRAVRRILGLPEEGGWDSAAVALTKGRFGTEHISASVAERIGETAADAAGLPPLWWAGRSPALGDYGDDVDAIRKLLGLSPGVLDLKCSDAVKRFEGNHGLTPTGVVTEDLARLLGEV